MHVDNQPKLNQTVVWIPDANFIGDIVFTYKIIFLLLYKILSKFHIDVEQRLFLMTRHFGSEFNRCPLILYR